MSKKRPADDSACRNRKASFRYEILETIECGIVLVGTEVKSLRNRDASLDEAFARIDGDELWLIDFHIAPYAFGPVAGHNPKRRRKLLVHARELARLRPKVEQKGQTLVPLRVYFNARGIAKVSLALGKGKRLTDKRQSMKAREQNREIQRAMQRKR
ncbi:MAG: SsrA-binding protein SmpB [Phycisphaerales bacterium]|nr:MAG: SsrA-binding protein SmpB [Phycisphaerales bacterium]